MGVGLVTGLAREGLQVGRDVLLIGFDDIEECAEIWPKLRSVDCDIARFGHDTAAWLSDWMRNGTAPPMESRAPATLNARASTGMSNCAG